MKIAVEGCAHGELDKIYESIEHLENKEQIKVDLLICCGDFQATRNEKDLESMAVPKKYRQMCSFYKYYTGEKAAPILTIFIGGNHEASNHLQELPYGGWAAPNIYYLGYAGVINVGGLRIAGVSGIYKPYDYSRGHFERPPYTENTKRSVYHIRNTEVFRLKQIKSPIDICISHDWPRGVYHYGNYQQLIRFKPFFKDEIAESTLGSAPCEELLHHLKPTYWFAAHLHCKFSALVPHKDDSGKETSCTKFLALDKCLPRRRYLQIIEVPHSKEEKLELNYDLEWLTILHYTNHLTSIKHHMNHLPVSGCDERWDFTPTAEEKDLILRKMVLDLVIPSNFHESSSGTPKKSLSVNHQTAVLCEKLGIDDPMTLFEGSTLSPPSTCATPDKTDISYSDVSFLDSSNDNSFSEKDDTISPFSIHRQKVSMVLPPPKFNDSITEEIEPGEDCSSEMKVENKETPAEPDLFIIDESPKRVLEENAAGNKKFKRRNQGIYNSTEE